MIMALDSMHAQILIGQMVTMVRTFGADMSSSTHIDNENKGSW